MAGELMKFEAPKLPSITASTVEQVLLKGDLAALKPEERVAYYDAVCKSVGLNPLTRPFAYISLNGKLVLYALRECTEQLRQIHGVHLRILSREAVEGCYIVTAQATLPGGRQDESIGAVAIENLKGEARANAVMKAETKAKRRVTLSICGLAFLDQTETETIPGEYDVPVNPQTGEMPELAPAPTLTEDIKRNPVRETKASRKSTTPFNALQAFGELKKRFQKIDKEADYYRILGEWGVEKSNQFPSGSEGLQQARGCYKQLSLEVQELELQYNSIQEVSALPDPIPLTIGSRIRFNGVVHEVCDSDDGYRWQVVK